MSSRANAKKSATQAPRRSTTPSSLTVRARRSRVAAASVRSSSASSADAAHAIPAPRRPRASLNRERKRVPEAPALGSASSGSPGAPAAGGLRKVQAGGLRSRASSARAGLRPRRRFPGRPPAETAATVACGPVFPPRLALEWRCLTWQSREAGDAAPRAGRAPSAGGLCCAMAALASAATRGHASLDAPRPVRARALRALPASHALTLAHAALRTQKSARAPRGSGAARHDLGPARAAPEPPPDVAAPAPAAAPGAPAAVGASDEAVKALTAV